ncbi:hypothetical protein ACVFYP_22345 [Roseomonas sp. F4]
MAGIGHNGPPETPAPALLDAIGVFAALRQACDAAGGQKAWAEAHGLTAQHVNDVLSCRREISDRVLAALGLRRVVRYAQARIGAASGSKAA